MMSARLWVGGCVAAVLIAVLSPGSLAGRTSSFGETPDSLQAGTRQVTDQELVRNGGFDHDKAGWVTNQMGTYVDDGFGANGIGPGMQIWPEFADPYIGYIFQELYLPSQLAAATVSFDFQFVPDAGAGLDFFRAEIGTESSTLAVLAEVTLANYPGETWQTTGPISLDAGTVSSLNSAHTSGQRVFIVMQLRAQSVRVNVDNVSVKATGTKDWPDWTGEIVFVGLDEGGIGKTVRTVDPVGGSAQTVWTHPNSGSTNALYDVEWKPNASEIAFSSNHETLYSAFRADVFGVAPDGTALRRITNPPSKAWLDAGGYQAGTVTGSVHNNYSNVTSLMLYIQGAQEAISIPATGYQDLVPFTVQNVAYLGPGLHYVVFIWAGGSSANCREYAPAVVQVVPGQTVDIGTVQFAGTCGEYDASTISWKRDGSEISADVITPRRFQATGEAIGTKLFNGSVFSGMQAWSPVDDSVVYYDGAHGQQGIYLTTAGGGRGTQVVGDQTAIWVTPAWLPDGSGFVYTLDHHLYVYDVAAGESTAIVFFSNEYVLNPSVSPDGRYVTFELWDGLAQHDLWIIDRVQPVEAWQLTDDGSSTNPDWSRTEPQTVPTPTPTSTSTATQIPSAVPTTAVPSTPTDGPSATPEASSTTGPTVSPTATATDTPGTTPTPTETGSPEPTLTPTPDEAATDTPTPDASVTPAATATAGPGPTSTTDNAYRIYLPVAKNEG